MNKDVMVMIMKRKNKELSTGELREAFKLLVKTAPGSERAY